MGIIAPSDNSAMIALSLTMARRFSMVGKVFGNRTEKSAIRKTVRITRP